MGISMIKASAMAAMGLLALAGLAQSQPEYEIGGPLAGIKLPPYPTYHGEPPGSPGNSATQYQLQLYPGSVENWRGYYFKYLRQRPIFDVQSQLRNWTAPDIPGCSSKTFEDYAQPVYKVKPSCGADFTGNYEPAVKVVRINPGDTLLDTSLGELPRGMYCVCAIAAVPTRDATAYCKDLFAVLEVNDLPGGGVSTYRKRVNYVDQFYSVVEIYFHAPEKREYKVKLSSSPESKTYFIVRNVTLEDMFVGFVRKPIKKKSNNPLPPAFIKAYKLWQDEIVGDQAKAKSRRELDDKIWNGLVSMNTHHFFVYGDNPKELRTRLRPGTKEMTAEEIAEKFGSWKKVSNPMEMDTLMVNDKLKLSYSVNELRVGKPLPEPYPIKDSGLGVSQPDTDGKTGWFNCPVAEAYFARRNLYQTMLRDINLKTLDSYAATPSQAMEQTHSALLAFARFVYDLPGLDNTSDLSWLVSIEGYFGRQITRHRETLPFYLSFYSEYTSHVELYDRFHELIKDNQPLADAIGGHVPWVKTPADVVTLFDTYLVQHVAKRIMRYNYYTNGDALLRVAAALGDKEMTKPWMEWAFTKNFSYPYPPTGIQDLIINAHDKCGLDSHSSSFYGSEANAASKAEGIERYCQAVGDNSFSMLNEEKYPALFAACHWPIEMSYAGYQHARIGDVTGPEKTPGIILLSNEELLRSGWLWTHDPAFAAILRQTDKPSSYQGKGWQEILEATAKIERMPYLTQPSRSIPNWAVILETGKRHDDFRFRRGVMVRSGCDYGHNHADSLDLQLAAHGASTVRVTGWEASLASATKHVAATERKLARGGTHGERRRRAGKAGGMLAQPLPDHPTAPPGHPTAPPGHPTAPPGHPTAPPGHRPAAQGHEGAGPGQGSGIPGHAGGHPGQGPTLRDVRTAGRLSRRHCSCRGKAVVALRVKAWIGFLAPERIGAQRGAAATGT